MRAETEPPWVEAVRQLDETVAAWERLLSSTRAAHPPDLATTVAAAEEAITRAASVRSAVASAAASLAELPPDWGTRNELDAHLERLVAALRERDDRWRDRLDSIAAELTAGRVVNQWNGRINATLDPLRIQAAAAVGAANRGTQPVALPGPHDGGWLAWAWKQEPESLDAQLAAVPALHEFIFSVEPKQFKPPAPSAPDEPVPPATDPTPPVPSEPVTETTEVVPVAESVEIAAPVPAPEPPPPRPTILQRRSSPRRLRPAVQPRPRFLRKSRRRTRF